MTMTVQKQSQASIISPGSSNQGTLGQLMGTFAAVQNRLIATGDDTIRKWASFKPWIDRQLTDASVINQRLREGAVVLGSQHRELATLSQAKIAALEEEAASLKEMVSTNNQEITAMALRTDDLVKASMAERDAALEEAVALQPAALAHKTQVEEMRAAHQTEVATLQAQVDSLKRDLERAHTEMIAVRDKAHAQVTSATEQLAATTQATQATAQATSQANANQLASVQATNHAYAAQLQAYVAQLATATAGCDALRARKRELRELEQYGLFLN